MRHLPPRYFHIKYQSKSSFNHSWVLQIQNTGTGFPPHFLNPGYGPDCYILKVPLEQVKLKRNRGRYTITGPTALGTSCDMGQYCVPLACDVTHVLAIPEEELN